MKDSGEKLSLLPPSVWRQRYEALRQQALGGMKILEGEPLGLVLLVRQGVAGWMRSWPKFQQESTPLPAPHLLSPTPLFQQQLTEVLVQMSLAHTRP